MQPSALNTAFCSMLCSIPSMLSMSCGIWQRILTSCTVFRMVPWQLCPGVRTQSSGELGRAGTLASSHWHTCPCPHGTLEIKALLFLEGGAADGQESAQELNPPPELFSLVVPLGDTALAGDSLKGERIQCVSLP